MRDDLLTSVVWPESVVIPGGRVQGHMPFASEAIPVFSCTHVFA